VLCQLKLLRLPKAEQDEGGVFGPNEIAVMTTAFDQILLDLKLMDRNDPMATMASLASGQMPVPQESSRMVF
jgi:hypothetical protein